MKWSFDDIVVVRCRVELEEGDEGRRKRSYCSFAE